MSRVALLITYTMLHPIVGGAFYRALRLAMELHTRGWSPVICNSGPLLSDPKVAEAAGKVKLVEIPYDAPAHESAAAIRQFTSFRPAVVIMGESAFETMKVYYEGARRLPIPMALLDQYYRPTLIPAKRAADLILLYGLETAWADIGPLRPPYRFIPPFIASVAPPAELPLPADFPQTGRITLVAYEENILRQGIRLLAGLSLKATNVIVISPLPGVAAELIAASELSGCATAALPLQSDRVVFGFISSSQVSLVSNGFIQVMDSLALGCPVIALKRGGGVGMDWPNYDERFYPYLSFEESEAGQRSKINQWLERSPFPSELLARLKGERNGAEVCAGLIEDLVARRPARNGLAGLLQAMTRHEPN